MHLNRFALPAVALLLGALGSGAAWASGLPQQGPPPGYGQAYGQERGWDMPPQELNDIQRQGFHDGVEGARHDFDDHRQPDVEKHEEFRHPHMPPEQREAYRDGFRRGYDVAMRHLMGGPGMAAPMPPPQPRGSWDMPPTEFNEVQQQGFRDGMQDARRDFDRHRNPNAENSKEFRHPPVPGELRDAYREGFRRGYIRAMDHLMGHPFQY